MNQSIILFSIAYLIMRISQEMSIRLFVLYGIVTQNYRGEKIPGVMGIVIIIVTIITVSIAYLINITESKYIILSVFMCSFMGLVGLIDDLFGDDYVKGFSGHIRQLLKGHFTTGGLKAIAGVMISIAITIQISISNWDVFINVLIILFTTNFINLLDTQPGRAVKGFILLTLVTGVFSNIILFHCIVLGVIIAYMSIDLKAKGMLGDVGSNFIGMVLGISIVMSITNIAIRIVILLVMLTLNLLSERISFSKIIEKTSILRVLDHLGR